MDLPAFSWTGFLQNGGYVLASFLLALPVAWEREADSRRMGIRTLPLVAVACCGYILVGVAVIGDDPRAHGRLLSGLVAGIGLIAAARSSKATGPSRGRLILPAPEVPPL